ncbi:MAG: type III secretion system export apparatus subunit SctT [Victivallales bacterium]|nr:type III secretion system export apparatus subunit SctT [Victivallales bacterium]
MNYSDFHKIVLAFVLSAIRISAAMAICPATSSTMITGLARRVAALAFAAVLVPRVIAQMEELSAFLFCAVALKEALVGFLIGFFASIPFWVAENTGNFIDNQRGATMGEVYSPLSGAQVSTTGILFTQIVSTIFYISGAILLFLGAIYASYDFIPLFGKQLAAAPDAHAFALDTLDNMMRTTYIISAPIIILMFLATIGLGFVNRTAPQLNVFFLSMPVKSALGIAFLIVYIEYILDMLMYDSQSALLGPLLRIFDVQT